ncbi:MAG: TetR/AcrR family transcriptional regulator, partial [Thermicanus sp.]|nr:TetR/AcrR family transcriptional regulator [Thermicanus sp.]
MKEIHTDVKDKELIETRRAQMVEAAVELFARKGFHKATTREIAAESGFSIGTLYEYIESKEDVLYLVCSSIHEEMKNGLTLSIQKGKTGGEKLKEAIIGYIRVVDRLDDKVLLIYQETKSLPKDAMRIVLRTEEEIAGIFARLLHEGVKDGSLSLAEEDIPLIAENIAVLGEMWAFRRWALRNRFTLEEFIEK